MFQFANIHYLWLLLVIPVLTVVYILMHIYKRHQLRRFGDPKMVEQLMPNASHNRSTIKFSILMVVLALLIVALARPQYGTKEETITRKGIESVVAIDVSNSMLARDIAPSRLDKAKQMLTCIIDHMEDDKLGLVVFAGEAYTQLPMTCDYVSAKIFINQLDPSLMGVQGTALGDAIRKSIANFGTKPSESNRAIILITDGEDHDDEAIEAAQEAQKAGIRIIVVGIGTTQGDVIPVPGTNNYHRDQDNNIVVSKLNETMCKQVAEAGNGIYVHCDNTNKAMRAIQSEIDKLSQTEIETRVFTEFDDQYPSFLLVALLLLTIEFFVFNRKNKSLNRLNIFKEK